MPIIFIAVRCFQCSTMQVKQQKKSSSKWTCVICNEKQSVRKIHARGHQAKDVRSFVQGFNASRSSGGRSDGSGWISPRSDGHSNSGPAAKERGGEGRRMDWSEYLDPKEDAEREEEEGGGSSGPMVTTELPTNKFGRTFPKCPLKLQPPNEITNLKRKSSKERQNETLQGNCGSVKCLKTDLQRAASKWSKYMSKEDDEDAEYIGSKFDEAGIGILNERDPVLNGLIVEEEVHPDFI